MELATFVLRQMEGVRSALGGLLADVTADEWVASAAAGQNPVGFTGWHVASIQDWAMCTWMRNEPTVRGRQEWAAKGMDTSFLPFGMSLDVAQEVARATRPQDVLAYADAVLEEANTLLRDFPAERFDELPPNRAHLADARYQVAGYLGEIADMHQQPYWRVFAGACIGHCRGHVGELELALAVIRNR